MLAYAVLMQAGLVENNPLKLSQISNLSSKKGMPQYAYSPSSYYYNYLIIN